MTPSSGRLSISRRTLIFLLGMALTELAITMSLVLIPVYIRELGASITQIGLFFTLAMVFPILVKLLGGWLADVVGRLQVIFFGSLAGVMTFAVYALTPTWQAALIAPALLAIAESLTIPAYLAYIADKTPEESRGRMFGVSNTIYRGAAIFGPPLGALLVTTVGFRFMFGVSTVIFAVAAIIFYFLLRSARSEFLSQQNISLKSLTSSLSQMWALFLAGGVIAWILVFDGVRDIALKLSFDLIPVYLTEIQGVTVQSIGIMDGIYGLALLLTLYPAGLLVDRTSERTVIVLALAANFGSRAVLALSGSLPGFTLSFILQAVAFGLFAPAFASLISKAVPQNLRGTAYGLFATSLSIFALPAPWIGSQIWEAFGPRVPFLISAAIGSLILLPIWFKYKIPKETEDDRGRYDAATFPTVGISDNATVLHARLATGQPDEFQAAGAEVVSQYAGNTSRTGDSALSATFGIAPNRAPPQVSALLATHAALSLIDSIESINVRRAQGGLPPLDVSIGIDTGSITMRPYFPDRKLNQGIRIGDEMMLDGNLVRAAETLQSEAEGGQVLISQRTYEYLTAVHHQFEFSHQSGDTVSYQVLGRNTELAPEFPRENSAPAK